MTGAQPSLEKARPESPKAAARLRVLIVAPSLGILGGQAVQAADLYNRLREEPTLEAGFLPVNPALPGPLRALQRVKYLRTLVTWPVYCLSLLLRVPRYDVLHVFSASYLSFVLAPLPAMLAGRLYRRKVVLNYHSGEAEDHLRRWRSAASAIRLADSIAVPSSYLVDVFRQFGLQARAIFNIVETERFPFRERNPLRPVFLSNRNLEPMYNVACTLRAFALIQRRIPDARLIVAGYGSQRSQLEALAQELGLRDVSFLGRVTPQEMPQVYDQADIYLNSSEIDNMPLSILEAFACGLPVVTTDAGGIPYVVEHGRTGLIVGKGDYRAMADAALRLLEDPALAAALIRNARRECSKYRWESVRQQWLELYHGVETDARQMASAAGGKA
ncbi:MAG TPA: glycosyltransferase family 4 protein [Bryobacteraceae bacterium]|nr:glycosyltransferase family 4 protein [Bryobacteraceae bacterium]HPU71462.1 glycosyltransferase family 4 protein [Bryobacteraceae bacterium]